MGCPFLKPSVGHCSRFPGTPLPFLPPTSTGNFQKLERRAAAECLSVSSPVYSTVFDPLSTCTRKYYLRFLVEKMEGLRGCLKCPEESTQYAMQIKGRKTQGQSLADDGAMCELGPQCESLHALLTMFFKIHTVTVSIENKSLQIQTKVLRADNAICTCWLSAQL